MAFEPELIVPETPERDLLDTPAAGPSAIRGSFVRLAGYVVGTLLSLVSVPLLIRHLGVSDYGRYVIVISLVTIVQGVTDVGLGQIGVREFATRGDRDRQRLLGNLLGVRFALTSAGVAMATAYAALVGYAGNLVLGTLIAGVGMVLSVIQGTFTVPLAAQLKLGWVTALDLLRQMLGVAGIVILVVAGAQVLSFLSLSVPVALAVLAATVVLVRGTMPLRPSFERAEWSLLIHAVLPFAAASVIGTLYLRITIILMSLLASDAQTGYYATSFTVIVVLIAVPALTVGSTLPVLARAARDDRERLRYVLSRLVEVTLIVGAGLGLVLAVGAGFVVSVLAKGKSQPSVVVLQIQSLAVVTQFVGAAWQYGLLALHRHRALLWISAAGLAVSVGLSLGLVPGLGARGAALAFVGAELASAAAAFVALRRARPDLRFSLRVPARVLGAVALACAILLVPGLGSFPSAVAAAIVYVVVLVASGALPPELTHALRRRIAG